MKALLNTLAYEFGFNNFNDFIDSLIHVKLLSFTIPLAITLSSIGAFLENSLGMQVGTMLALLVLLILELVTGLWAAKSKKIKIESRKFARFGLKVIVWFGLFFVLNSLTLNYEDKEGMLNSLAHTSFTWLYTILMIFVTMEYLISVLENYSKITGEDTSPIIVAIRKRLDKWLGRDDEADFFNKKHDAYAIIGNDGKFIKLNDKWECLLGYPIEDILNNSWMHYMHEEDKEASAAKLAEAKATNFVSRFKRKDGQYIKLNWTVSPTDGGSRWNCIVVILEQPLWLEEHIIDK